MAQTNGVLGNFDITMMIAAYFERLDSFVASKVCRYWHDLFWASRQESAIQLRAQIRLNGDLFIRINCAAKGYKELTLWFLDTFPTVSCSMHFARACMKANLIEVFQHPAFAKHYRFDEHDWSFAAELNSVQTLNLLEAKNISKGPFLDFCRIAARSGSLEALQWLLAHQVPFDEGTLMTAAFISANLALIQWLFDEGFAIDWDMQIAMAQHQENQELLQWLQQNMPEN